MNIKDITITSLECINAFNISTGAYRFTLDELQSAKIANTEDKTDITGKGGRKLTSLKKNKAVTVSGTNGLVSGGLLEAQTGGTFTTKNTNVLVPDYLTISSNTATTTYTAVGTSGAEIKGVYIINTDGSLGTELTQAATVAADKFTYVAGTKLLTFNTSAYEDGTEIAVFYDRQISADVLENISDNYSEKLSLYVDAIGEDKCGNIYRIQFYIPKANFNGNFDFDMGDNQTVHAFEAESLAGACSGTKSLWTYTIYGNDTADVA